MSTNDKSLTAVFHRKRRDAFHAGWCGLESLPSVAELQARIADLEKPARLWRRLEALHARRSEWADRTFPPHKPRGRSPIGPLLHLQKEAKEAIDAWESPHALGFNEEMSDCGLLVGDGLHCGGITLEVWLGGMEAKHLVNERRIWNIEGAKNGEPVEHIEAAQ